MSQACLIPVIVYVESNMFFCILGMLLQRLKTMAYILKGQGLKEMCACFVLAVDLNAVGLHLYITSHCNSDVFNQITTVAHKYTILPLLHCTTEPRQDRTELSRCG